MYKCCLKSHSIFSDSHQQLHVLEKNMWFSACFNSGVQLYIYISIIKVSFGPRMLGRSDALSWPSWGGGRAGAMGAGGPGHGTGPTCMDMHGSPLVYIYIYIYRVWSSCLAPPMGNWRSLHDWSPQRAHAYCLHRNLFRWIARRLQTPLRFKVGHWHGLRRLLAETPNHARTKSGWSARPNKTPPLYTSKTGGQISCAPISQLMEPIYTNMPEQPRHHR